MVRRKLALDKYTPTLTAVTLFYSRIILKKLTTENKTTFRKLEKSVKFSVKCDADIKFINCIVISFLELGHILNIYTYIYNIYKYIAIKS